MHDADVILKQAQIDIAQAQDLKALEQCRVHYLGKKSQLTELLKSLGALPQAQRPLAGQQINLLKENIQQLIDARSAALKASQVATQLANETLDISLPGRKIGCGSLHPITQTFNELTTIFTQMGFMCMQGPEIEDDYFNFTALNIPPLHPARALQDTFYLPSGKLLRTQMSPVQIHTMKKIQPPLRMVALGKVYRRDFDLTHTPMFHQMECLMVDEKVTFADLKGVLQHFLAKFFYPNIGMRLRTSYFPFTEPSAEVDIECLSCQGKGCRICKNTGWLEVLGCGMVHPHVLAAGDIDASRYRGFAIGAGIDRLTMLKRGINDLRALFENDIRFLTQFS
jgi:phenylalanyl-tRNA synthetase alpha chain